MLTASLLFSFGQLAESPTLAQRLLSHITLLSSDSLEGRGAGTKGAEMAREHIASHFHSIGLMPYEGGYFHSFGVKGREGARYVNVVAELKGHREDSYILVGAHYDHLGAPEGEIHPGADDNASGVATLLEVARLMVESGKQTTHTILFAAFDAEEIGLFGSAALANELPEGSVALMVNMDMVGRLGDGALEVEGVGTLKGVKEVVNSIARSEGVSIKPRRFEQMPLVATDTDAFARQGYPTLSLTTGLHSDYHRTSDSAEKIDIEGVERTTRFVARLIEELDGRQEGLQPTGRVAAKHRSGINEWNWGLTFAFGNNRHIYPESAIEGRSAGAWNVGLTGQYTFRNVALRCSAVVERLKALTPADLNNPYGKAATLTSTALTVPLDVMVKTLGRHCFYITVGGYGSRMLCHKLEGAVAYSDEGGNIRASADGSVEQRVSNYEWGWSWGLGARVGSFYFEATNRYALTPLYTSGPEVRNRTTLCTMGLFF